MSGELETYRDGAVEWSGCCDCGLSHLILYRIKDNVATLRWYRDDWDTEESRRKMSEVKIKWLIKLFQKELRRRKK